MGGVVLRHLHRRVLSHAVSFGLSEVPCFSPILYVTMGGVVAQRYSRITSERRELLYTLPMLEPFPFITKPLALCHSDVDSPSSFSTNANALSACAPATDCLRTSSVRPLKKNR